MNECLILLTLGKLVAELLEEGYFSFHEVSTVKL